MKKTNRRDLLKNAFVGGATLSSLGLMNACSNNTNEEHSPEAPAQPAASPEPTGFVSEESSVAQSLSYKEDATSVSTDLRADKGKTKGSEQFCSNCQFFTDKGDGSGSCSLFPGKLVKSQAWCRSWSLKAQS